MYAGCRIRQLTSFSIHVSQEDFCNSLSPVAIQSDGSRSDKDPITPSETSQAWALLMKAQRRSLQGAPQYAARIGIASSTLSDGKLADLREANSIIRDMRKTAKEDLAFRNLNFGRTKRLKYTNFVFLHWGDAGHNNRPTGSSTGGFVSGISSPEIGNETPVTLIGDPGNFDVLPDRRTAQKHKELQKLKTKAGEPGLCLQPCTDTPFDLGRQTR